MKYLMKFKFDQVKSINTFLCSWALIFTDICEELNFRITISVMNTTHVVYEQGNELWTFFIEFKFEFGFFSSEFKLQNQRILHQF